MNLRLSAALMACFLSSGMTAAAPETPDPQSRTSQSSQPAPQPEMTPGTLRKSDPLSLDIGEAGAGSRETLKQIREIDESLKGREREILGEDFSRELDRTSSRLEQGISGRSAGDPELDKRISAAADLAASSQRIDRAYQIRKLSDVIRDAAPEDYEKLTRELAELEREEQEDAASFPENAAGFPGRVYVFLSWSMGEDRLKEIFRAARDQENVVLAFRGFLPGETITEGNRRLRSLIGRDQEDLEREMKSDRGSEKDPALNARWQRLREKAEAGLLPPPQISVDPAAFQDFGITHVPEVMYFVPGHKENTCQTVLRMDSPVSACYLSRAHGLANPFFLPEKARAGTYGDLGTFGEVFPVAEPDIREVMKERLGKIDWEKKKRDAQKNFFRKRSEFGHDTLLEYAMYKRERLIDPSVTLDGDITDKYGKVLIAAGTRVNPLDVTPFTGILAVFDPGRESELQEIRKWLSEAGLGSDDRRITFLATRIPTSDKEDGWDFYTKMTHDLGNHVFLLRDDIKKAFSLRVTPSIVTADPERKLLRVTELGRIPAPGAGEPEIEPRGDRLTIRQVISGMNAGSEDKDSEE